MRCKYGVSRKNKALATCKSIIFIFSCGRSHISFTCWCDPTSRVGSLPLKNSGYFYFVGTPEIISFIGVYLFFYFLMKYLIVGILQIILLIPPFSYSIRLPVGWDYVYVGVSPFFAVFLFGVTFFIALYLPTFSLLVVIDNYLIYSTCF